MQTLRNISKRMELPLQHLPFTSSDVLTFSLQNHSPSNIKKQILMPGSIYRYQKCYKLEV